MRRRRRRYKPRIIQVNLSSSFVARTKCVQCGQEPQVYYYANKPYLFIDPKGAQNLFKSMTKWMKRMSSDWFMEAEPKFFKEMSAFNHMVDYKGYNPRLHKSRGVNPQTNTIQYISCWSGCTVWAFSDSANTERQEISQRKSRHKYPQKFIY